MSYMAHDENAGSPCLQVQQAQINGKPTAFGCPVTQAAHAVSRVLQNDLSISWMFKMVGSGSVWVMRVPDRARPHHEYYAERLSTYARAYGASPYRPSANACVTTSSRLKLEHPMLPDLDWSDGTIPVLSPADMVIVILDKATRALVLPSRYRLLMYAQLVWEFLTCFRTCLRMFTRL